MLFVVKTNKLQNPAHVRFFSPDGIMMISQNLTNLVHQLSGFGSEFFGNNSSGICHKVVPYISNILNIPLLYGK